MSPRLCELLETARQRLASTPFAAPAREAHLLAGRVLGLSEAQIIARDEMPVAAEVASRFEDLLSRRLAGEPIAYLFGEKEFFGRPFAVDRRVLIPRPETEHLAEAALRSLAQSPGKVVDVGTGSGCIAVTLALERPGLEVLATDVSPSALAVAHQNRRRHDVERRVRLLGGDLLSALRLDELQLVVANLPYIDLSDEASLSPEIRNFEPRRALFAATRGLALMLRLVEAAGRLRPGARLLLEIGAGQVEELCAAAEAGPCVVRGVLQDYAGIARIVELERR